MAPTKSLSAIAQQAIATLMYLHRPQYAAKIVEHFLLVLQL